jgi:hypothetical protein
MHLVYFSQHGIVGFLMPVLGLYCSQVPFKDNDHAIQRSFFPIGLKQKN